jgi:hypothetical protein
MGQFVRICGQVFKWFCKERLLVFVAKSGFWRTSLGVVGIVFGTIGIPRATGFCRRDQSAAMQIEASDNYRGGRK